MNEILSMRTKRSKTFSIGDRKLRWRGSIGVLHYPDEQGKWQDIDAAYEEADTDGFNLKFTKLPYLIRMAEDSGRRIYPDRNDLSYWIEFKKPFASMGAPTRQGGWFYWDFANARIGVKVRPERVKFGFRLKDSNAPTSITIPFSSQGITRKGYEILHNGQVVGYLRKPTATDALGIERDCQVSWGAGSVTISLDTAGLAFPIDIDPTWSVSASTDDCYFALEESSWWFFEGGDQQQAGFESFNKYKMGGGMRFLNITIPQGTIIDAAYLTLIATSSLSGTVMNSRITGEDVDDAATWSTLADYQARRGTVVDGANDDYLTDAQVDWDAIPAWTEGESYNSPEIKTIIQEIINRVGWESGNALALWWDDHENRCDFSVAVRSGASWDHATLDPPALTIEYELPVGLENKSANMGSKMVAAGLI